MRLRNIPGAKAAITGSSYVVQNPEEWKGKWKQCFTKEQPLHIEVGMGKGRFLMDMASLDRKSTRLNSSHIPLSRMPSSA